MSQNKQGFTCPCGKRHKYSAHVHANHGAAISHTCKCGRVHIVKNYVARLTRAAKAKGVAA